MSRKVDFPQITLSEYSFCQWALQFGIYFRGASFCISILLCQFVFCLLADQVAWRQIERWVRLVHQLTCNCASNRSLCQLSAWKFPSEWSNVRVTGRTRTVLIYFLGHFNVFIDVCIEEQFVLLLFFTEGSLQHWNACLESLGDHCVWREAIECERFLLKVFGELGPPFFVCHFLVQGQLCSLRWRIGNQSHCSHYLVHLFLEMLRMFAWIRLLGFAVDEFD